MRASFSPTLKLDRQKRWLPGDGYLDKSYSVKVYFSDNHTSYLKTLQYVTKAVSDFIQSKEHPDLRTSSKPYTKKVANVKCKVADGAGNFSVNRKRDFDPLNVFEIIFTQIPNFYILPKLTWLSIFPQTLTKSKNQSKKLETWKTRDKKLKNAKCQGWRFYLELKKPANALSVVKVIC